jgi:hypothetical protein
MLFATFRAIRHDVAVYLPVVLIAGIGDPTAQIESA